jgi:S1-C subfamily serine protease
VTCQHVLVGKVTEAFRAATPSRKYPVEIIHQDEARDVAILRVPEEAMAGLTPLQRAPRVRRNIGDTIHVGGFPRWSDEHEAAITPGVIVQRRQRGGDTWLSISAGIVAGMSGAPVVSGGLVIGIAVTGADSDGAIGPAVHGVVSIEALFDHLPNTLPSETKSS